MGLTTSVDWRRARAETPGCKNVIHFNNAGAALMPDCVIEAAIEHVRNEGAWGGYEAAERAEELIEHAYDAAATLLGCDATEIAIVDSASRAWDLAFSAVKFVPGDVILTSAFEYANNYIAMLQARKNTGARIVVVPSEESGQVSPAALGDALDRWGKHVRIVSLTHVPTNSGLVNPAAEVGGLVRAARRAGQIGLDALYVVDACQSVGQIPVDVGAIGCDVLTTCSRKYLRGPRGLGILYVRGGILDAGADTEPALLDLRTAEWTTRDRYRLHAGGRRFETWEANNAGKIALGVAIDHARRWNVASIEGYVAQLAATLREGLRQTPGVRVHDRGRKHCGIVSFTIDGYEPVDVRAYLGRYSINVSVCERALIRLDMEDRGLDSVVRASVHYYNSAEEVDAFVRRIEELAWTRTTSG